jgi:hypothetical protein
MLLVGGIPQVRRRLRNVGVCHRLRGDLLGGHRLHGRSFRVSGKVDRYIEGRARLKVRLRSAGSAE